MKSTFFAAIACLVLCTGTKVLAADMPIKAPPVAFVPAWSWTGFHAGVNGGYGISHSNLGQSSAGDSLPETTGAANFETSTFKSTIAPKGAIFGLQGGFDYQIGSIVWGVEADWQWTSQGGGTCSHLCDALVTPPNTLLFGPGNTLTYLVSQKIDWFATARGRLGWTPVNGAMIYATGGAAWMGIDETDVVARTFNPRSPFGPSGTTASFSNTAIGFAVGAGAEIRLWGNWTGKLEYLHIDVGGMTNAATHNNTVPPAYNAVITTTTSRIKDDVVRAGLNYNFGDRAVRTAEASAAVRQSPWNWTGFYLGPNGGYGIASSHVRSSTTNPFTPVTTGSTIGSTIAPQGGFLGVQGGFNYQTGSVVWGVEGDLQWDNQSDTSCSFFCRFQTSLPQPGFTSSTFTVEQKANWFGTVRARVGWTPVDGALIYATGGAAWMGIDETDRVAGAFENPVPPPTTASTSTAASFRNTVFGYAVGAGGELRLWGNWTGKFEYLHLELGGMSHTATLSAEPAVRQLTLTTTTGPIRNDIYKVGLNYHFNGPAVVAKY